MVGSSYLLAGVRPWSKRTERSWCGRRDSNPHLFRYQDLNLARLPVPPRPPGRRSARDIAGVARGASGTSAGAGRAPSRHRNLEFPTKIRIFVVDSAAKEQKNRISLFVLFMF